MISTTIQEMMTTIKEIPASWPDILTMRKIPDRCIGLQGPFIYAQTMRNLCASVRMQTGCISNWLGLGTRVPGAAVSISYASKSCSNQTAVEAPSGCLAKLDSWVCSANYAQTTDCSSPTSLSRMRLRLKGATSARNKRYQALTRASLFHSRLR